MEANSRDCWAFAWNICLFVFLLLFWLYIQQCYGSAQCVQSTKLYPWFWCQKNPLKSPQMFLWRLSDAFWQQEGKGRKPLFNVLLWNRPLRHTCVCLCLQIWSAGRKRGSLQSSVLESEWAFGWKTPKPKGRRRKVAFTQQQTYTNSRRCARPPLHLMCVNVWWYCCFAMRWWRVNHIVCGK